MTDSVRGSADARPNLPITTIGFHGAELIVRAGDSPATTLVAMKPVVEGMGLDWKSQHAKLKAHPVLGSTVVEITMVAEDGKPRSMTALPLNRLHFWLATIQPNKVRPDLRDRVITYQTEAADVLFAHFFGRRLAGPERPALEQDPAAAALREDGRYLVVVRRGRVAQVQDLAGACIVNGANPVNVATFLREYVSGDALAVALDVIADRAAVQLRFGAARPVRPGATVDPVPGWQGEDPVALFAAHGVEHAAGVVTATAELWLAFQDFCRVRGLVLPLRRAFETRFAQMGFAKRRFSLPGRRSMAYAGLRPRLVVREGAR